MLIAVTLIALVIFQRGKGSEMGAAFGAGASGTMFGSQGSTPFMVKLIAGLAIAFFCTSLGLNYLVSKSSNQAQPDILDMADPGSVTPSSSDNQNTKDTKQPVTTSQEKSAN